MSHSVYTCEPKNSYEVLLVLVFHLLCRTSVCSCPVATGLACRTYYGNVIPVTPVLLVSNDTEKSVDDLKS